MNSSFQGTAAGVNGSEKMITQSPTQTTATVLIHLYFAPSVQAPGVKLSPARQAQVHRRDVGDVEGDHGDRHDGEERDRDSGLVAGQGGQGD